MPFAATRLDLENIIVVLLHVVVQSLSRVQLFNHPMDCSTPDSSVFLYFPEITQIHVH